MNTRSRPQEDRPASSANVPVVALGGSAGALTAFHAFFNAMPADSGAAVVVIQHMSPDHASQLPDILAQYTRMPVAQAAEDMPLNADCVYVIPPNHQMTIRQGSLHLQPVAAPHTPRLPIDAFLRSLAEDLQERAVAILLSGAGSDGTLGARAIRGAGGLVIVQDPQTCQFGDLPRSALAAGLADQVLPPDQMPAAVIAYLNHPYARGFGHSKAAAINASPEDVQGILALVQQHTGADFRCYKPGTILRRIGRRMGLRRFNDAPRYLAELQTDPAEVRRLLNDLLINVTSFFRDSEAFEALRERVFAPMLRDWTVDSPVRVWVPGCATGEEAYSLAILLLEEIARSGKSIRAQVFATDLDEEALDVGRAGIFPENIATDVSPERLARFFVRTETGFQAKDTLRETLTFAVQNVISDPPFSRVDLISCRNLLIYLDAEAQAKLMALFNFALKPGGCLFLGRSETAAGQDDLFEPLSRSSRISRRLEARRPLVLDCPILPGKRRTPLPAAATGVPPASNFADVIRVGLLRHFNASAVLVDSKGSILQFHGEAHRYLDLPAPGPVFDLFALARERLAAKLRLALHKAIHDGKPVTLESVPVIHGDQTTHARVTVTIVRQAPPAEPLLLIFFEDAAPPAQPATAANGSDQNDAVVKRLEEELRVTQQDLQATIQELQSSNEELRAANEEVTSTNEELGSINEELLSSTEELQSTNEELTATVSQLQEKVSQLNHANEEVRRSEQRFRTLVESSPNAVLLAGVDGTITQLNRQAEAVFGYGRDELVGRTIEVLVPKRFRNIHLVYRAEYAAHAQRRPMGASRDLYAIRKDGTEFPVEIGLTPLQMPEGLVTMATITDITERKRLARETESSHVTQSGGQADATIDAPQTAR